MTEQIVEKMRNLRLSNMARAYSERHGRGEFRQMSADEAICLLVDDEWSARQNKKLATVILKANFKPEGAFLENLRYQPDRGFVRGDITPFRSHEWIRTGANVLLFGPTGAGKSYLAEAICDRLRHNAYVLNLKGVSMRSPKPLQESGQAN